MLQNLFRRNREISGWVRSETCWVVADRDMKAPIVGIVIQRAAVTVRDAGKGWYRIVSAPVRSLKAGSEGVLIDGKDLYLRKDCISKTPPGRWK